MAKRVEAFRLSGRVEVDAKKAKTELKDVRKEAKATASEMKSLKGSVGGGLKSLGGDILSSLGNISEVLTAIPVVGSAIKSTVGAITGPLAALAQRGIEFNDTIELAQIGFETILGSTEKAVAHINSLKKFAASTPFEFKDLVGYSQQMQGMGFSADEIIPKLTAVGNALSAMGKPENLAQVITQLGQMKAKGKVSAEELNSIAESGLPVYKMLADAVGMTVAQVQKLGEQGRLNADAAIDILTEGFQSKYDGAMKKISERTRTGALSNFEDNLNSLSGQATKEIHDGMTQALQTMNQGFDRGLGTGFAATIGRAGGALSSLFNGALQGLLSGDFMTKMTDAAGNIVSTTSDTIVNNTPTFVRSMSDMAVAGYDSFAEQFGIKSPARKMIAAGEYIAEGLRIGLSRSQAKVYAAMRRLFDTEPDFLPKLIEGAIKRGINPDDLLNVIGIESSFQKAIQNKFGYTGLIQFGDAERKEVGMPRETWGAGGRTAAKEFLSQLSATDQLEYVFKFLDKRAGGRVLDTLAELYSTVGAGSYKGTDETIRFSAGQKGYANNPQWDVNKDGRIQNWEFGPAAAAKLGAGLKFTVNGQAITKTNPMPVAVVESYDYNAGRDPFSRDQAMAQRAGIRPIQVEVVKNSATAPNAAINGAAADSLPPAMNAHLREILSNAQVELTFTPIIADAKALIVEMDKLPPTWAEAQAKMANTTATNRARLIKPAEKDIEALALRWGQVAEGFNSVLSSALQDTSGSFGEWTRNLASSFAKMLADMAAQLIASQITQWLFGTLSGGAGATGAGGILGNLSGIFGRIFGGFRASGGDVIGGRSYVVGENGPEIYTPGAHGFVTPNHVAFGGGGAQGAQGAQAINMRNVIVFDKKHVTEAMQGTEGEQVTMAHIRSNISQIKQFMSQAA